MSATRDKYRELMQRGMPEVEGLHWHEPWGMFVVLGEGGGDRPITDAEADTRLVAHANRKGITGRTLDEVVTEARKR